MYNVYQVHSVPYYQGYSLIAADSAEEANQLIKQFQESDKDNKEDSAGYDEVTEDNIVEELTSNTKGIVVKGIYYKG